MQSEDKWKAGQEAAFNHWRNENDARVRVEEDWKALHESRMVNVRPVVVHSYAMHWWVLSSPLAMLHMGRHRSVP